MARMSIDFLKAVKVKKVKHKTILIPSPLDELEETLMSFMMIGEGILPMPSYVEQLHQNVLQAIIKTLPENEARRIKRRFRKIWRNCARADARRSAGHLKQADKKYQIDNRMEIDFGKGRGSKKFEEDQFPILRSHAVARKRIVRQMIYGYVMMITNNLHAPNW